MVRSTTFLKAICIVSFVSALVFSGGVWDCPQAAEKVKVGTQRGMYSALAFVVKEKDLLKAEGLDAEWSWFTGSPSSSRP